jgi:hypothetical protein
MRPLTATQLFDVWERGLSSTPAARALAILAASEPAADADELRRRSVGRRDAELLRLRAATFGRELTSIASCTECGESLEWSVDAAALLSQSATQPAGETEIAADGFTIRFRPPTAGDVDSLPPAAAEGVAALEDELLARCVLAIRRNGQEVGVGALSSAARHALSEAIAAADPSAELRVAAVCPSCSTATEALLDVPSFFWAEIEAWVARTAADVHALARAYGWSEREVLAMSPQRRRLYLAQLGA